MEDAATAEISRAQLWQWIRHRSPIQDDGDGDGFFTPDDYTRLRDAEMEALRAEREDDPRCLEKARELLDELVLSDEFIPFLTLPAYQLLDGGRCGDEGTGNREQGIARSGATGARSDWRTDALTHASPGHTRRGRPSRKGRDRWTASTRRSKT